MEIRDAVKREIDADPILSGVLGDRVFTRPLSRKGPRSTPEAWDEISGLILPCVSISGMDGQADQEMQGSVVKVITIWYRVPDSPEMDPVLDELIEYTSLLFRDRILDLSDDEIGPRGRGSFLEYLDQFGAPSDPFIEACRFTYIRFRGMEVVA